MGLESFLLDYGIIIGLAILGYWLLKIVHFPAPAIMGPMVAIGSYQVLGGGLPELSVNAVNAFQIILGLSLGARINYEKLTEIRKLLIPSLVIAIWTLLSTAGMTIWIYHYTPDIATALFSAAPGGISEMTVLALAYNSEVPIVSTYQFVRLVVIISVVPLIAKWVKERERMQGLNENPLPGGQSSGPEKQPDQDLSLWRQLPLYAIGIIGGIILLALNFPGGGVIGAMVALAAVNIALRKQYVFPGRIMLIALLGVGASIGLEFTPEIVQTIKAMFLPIVGFSVLIVLSNLAVGWYIRHLTKGDMVTALLGSAPGGLSQMLVVAEEMNADGVAVSILQLVRLIVIITCIPLIAVLVV